MKLQVPFIELPLRFDADVLAGEIEVLGETPWRPHPQGFAGNSMLPLVAAGGDAANESFAGAMAPTPELQRCPYLTQVIASLGATVGRSRLMRLSGRAEVTRHADQGYYWAERVRVHVPVVTQPNVRFECGEAAINMAAGECWLFDTWRQHRVLNDATQARIHLVVDTVGGGEFWDLVGQGRPHPTAGPVPWDPKPLAPGPDPVTFACEAVNVPTVMSPWELNGHLGLLIADAVPHPLLPQVRQHTMRFARQWQGLWAQYGDHPQGRDQFRSALAAYLEVVALPGSQLQLVNELHWMRALMAIVGRVAVVAEDAATGSTALQQHALGDNA